MSSSTPATGSTRNCRLHNPHCARRRGQCPCMPELALSSSTSTGRAFMRGTARSLVRPPSRHQWHRLSGTPSCRLALYSPHRRSPSPTPHPPPTLTLTDAHPHRRSPSPTLTLADAHPHRRSPSPTLTLTDAHPRRRSPSPTLILTDARPHRRSSAHRLGTGLRPHQCPSPGHTKPHRHP